MKTGFGYGVRPDRRSGFLPAWTKCFFGKIMMLFSVEKKTRLPMPWFRMTFPLFSSFFGNYDLKAETKSKKHRPFPKKRVFHT